MKKIICLLAGLMLMGTVFCQENAGGKNEEVKPQIEFLINQNLKNNMDTISVLSLQLPASDKMNLYNTYKKDPLKPVLLNSLVGFGVGSYLDGDLLGGIIGSCLDGVAIFGCFLAVGGYLKELEAYQKKYTVFMPDFMDFAIIPLLITVGARVYEGTRANKYVKKYNKRLVDALNLNTLSTSFVPVLKQDGSLAMTFNVQLTF